MVGSVVGGPGNGALGGDPCLCQWKSDQRRPLYLPALLLGDAGGLFLRGGVVVGMIVAVEGMECFSSRVEVPQDDVTETFEDVGGGEEGETGNFSSTGAW